MTDVKDSTLPWILVLRYYTPADDFLVCSMTCKDLHDIVKNIQTPIEKPSLNQITNSLIYLKWARSLNYPWTEQYERIPEKNICVNAILNGDLNLLQWAVENGCPWGYGTCAYAALEGRLDILQWAREKGCPWDEDTCSYAAENGHLKIIQWARENDCPWDEWT